MGYGYLRQAWAAWRADDRPAALRSALIVAAYAVCALLIAAGLIAAWGRARGSARGAGVMAVFAPRRRVIGLGLLAAAGALGVALWMAGLVPASIEARITNTLNEFVGFGDVRACL